MSQPTSNIYNRQYQKMPSTNGSVFVMNQSRFVRTQTTPEQFQKHRQVAIDSNGTKYHSRDNTRKAIVSTHMNYIAPKDSSQRLSEIKARAIGKTVISDSNMDVSVYTQPRDARAAQRRVRGIGYVAPPKKGSLFR